MEISQRLLVLVFLLTTLNFSASCSKYSRSTAVPNPGKEKEKDVDETNEILELNGAKAQRIVLSNNLQVVLVSSPTSKKSAAALAVKVGSANDPVEMQGLAHYLEHMLFLGTKEFPEAGDYKDFLTKNGGSSNASTAEELTNYFFETLPSAYDETLNRFSRFFVSPLFSENYSQKEKEAINQEYSLRRDSWKQFQSDKVFRKGKRHFSIGNTETLKNATPADSREFFEKHYFAEAMTLSLVGPDSLEELKVLAEKYFSDIPSRPQNAINSYPIFKEYDESLLPAEVMLVTDQELKMLQISVPVKNPKEMNYTVAGLISSILGDETEKSLMVQLQSKGWVETGAGKLRASAGEEGISLRLMITDNGFVNRTELVQAILGYIKSLKSSGFQPHLAQEVLARNKGTQVVESYFEIDSGLASQITRILSTTNPTPYTWQESIQGRALTMPTKEEYEEYFSRVQFDKPLVLTDFPSNTEVDIEYTPYTNMDQAGVYMTTNPKDNEKVIVDSAFGWAFQVNDLDLSKTFDSQIEFQLPAVNPFIPKDLSIFEEDFSKGTLLAGPFGTVRFTQFLDNPLPRAIFSAMIFSNRLVGDTEDRLFLEVVSQILSDRFLRNYYNASSADIALTVKPSQLATAIIFEYSGWSSGFTENFKTFIKTVNLDITPQEFEEAKMLLVRKKQIDLSGSPKDLAFNLLVSNVRKGHYTNSEGLALVQNYDFADFQNKISQFQQSVGLKGNLSGNIQNKFAMEIIDALAGSWKLTWNPEENTTLPYIQMNDQLKDVVAQQSPNVNNGTYIGYWKHKEIDLNSKERFYTQVVSDWLSNNYYQELRTEKNLAYSVGAFSLDTFTTPSFVLYIESSHPFAKIKSISDEFFVDWIQNFANNFSQEDLDFALKGYLNSTAYPASNEDRHNWLFVWNLRGYNSREAAQEVLNKAQGITIDEVNQFLQGMIEQKDKPDASIEVITKKDMQ